MLDIFVQNTKQIVLALPIFIKGANLKLRFIEISNKLQNQLVILLLKMSNADNEICGLDMS